MGLMMDRVVDYDDDFEKVQERQQPTFTSTQHRHCTVAELLGRLMPPHKRFKLDVEHPQRGRVSSAVRLARKI